MRVSESPHRVIVENVRERSHVLVEDLAAIGTQIERWLRPAAEVTPTDEAGTSAADRP